MMASGTFDLVIFDCDGVLVDSEVIACRALSESLVEFGLTLAVDEIADRFIGTSTRDMYAALEAEWGCVLPDALKARVVARSRELFDRELRPVAGVAVALGELSGGPDASPPAANPRRSAISSTEPICCAASSSRRCSARTWSVGASRRRTYSFMPPSAWERRPGAAS
jgi:beta-phosphoglucomutase-like phosphatase (HAD superfamily)